MEVLDEEKLEIIDENSPVYVLEDAIADVRSLNDLNLVIEDINAAKDTAENEKLAIEKSRQELNDEIGIINNGRQIQEVAVKLSELRELDLQLESKKKELEGIYANLRKQEEDRKVLDITTRRMVDEMTKEYNELVKKYISLVDKYRSTANFNYYDESNKVVDKLGEYKEFKSFEDILDSNEEKEEAKEEVAEQKVEETEEKAVEAPEAEKAVVTELSEVKVDSLPEAEGKEEEKAVVTPIVEEKAVEAAPSEPVQAEVTAISSEDKVVMPTFEELMAKAKEAEEQGVEKAEVTPIAEEAKVEEAKPEVTAEAPVAEVTPIANAPEVKPQGNLEIKVLTSTNDHIAGSNVAKLPEIIKMFEKGESKELEKTLVLGA